MAPVVSAEAVKMFGAMEAKPTAADAKKLAEFVRDASGAELAEGGFFTALESALTANKKKEKLQEAGTRVFGALSAQADCNVEPYLVDLFPHALELVGSKTKAVAKAAHDAVLSFVKRMSNNHASATMTMKNMLSCLDSTKWQVKVVGLEAISAFSTDCQEAVCYTMPELVPAVCSVIHDTKAEVCTQAEKTLKDIASVIENKDIDNLVPVMLQALMEPTQVPDCVFTLSCTKFVATVQRPELALVTPLLVRGFNENITKITRQCAKITDNLSKLVEVASEAEPLLPQLTPAMESAAEHTSDPECRGVCATVVKQLEKLKATIDKEKEVRLGATQLLKMLGDDKKVSATDAKLLQYVADQLEALFLMKELDVDSWTKTVSQVADKAEAKGVATRLFDVCAPLMRGEEKEEEEDAAELCNCNFTLAYGSKILLKNTSMKLLRGLKYGLLGPNECGKTSLLKAIANDQVEGFPPSTEVRTVFVEADILGELSHLTCIEYIFEDPRIKAAGLSQQAVETAMSSVGFAGANELQGGKAARIMDPVSSLSGGWRMKLALARAMLQKADILLMDDPTNHLDVKNVAWVEDYINSLTDVTCIIVSSNPGTLENCCQRLIHFDNLRLHPFKGKLSEFVEKYPECKSYFELKSAKGLEFSFPDPGFLEGVTSRGKVLIRMDNVDFAYPGNPKNTVENLTVRVSMASRVACLGPNGAGKSTMIKLLTGELEPATGSVWKNSNAKIAYVAQHAFHHIEQHLKKTPTEYVLWRYEYGTDKEALNKVTMVLTEKEEKMQEEARTWEYTNDDGLQRLKGTIEKLTGVRKPEKRGGYKYEVRFTSKNPGEGVKGFVNDEKLNEHGWAKAVKQTAEKILAEEGRYGVAEKHEHEHKHKQTHTQPTQTGTRGP